MEDLIFHMFFVVPLTRCITSSERPWNKKNPRSGTILAVVALFLIGVFQSRRDGENYYEVLNVRPNSPPRVISAAYRKLAVQYHPDKNQHPDAKEAFARIREAYGVLMNEKRRSSYLRFGDYSKEGDVDEEQFYDILFLAVFQLLVPFLLAFLYTYKSDCAPSREIFSCYVATSFALELLLRFDERGTHYLTFLPFVGDWLPFEKVQLLHSWMPVILNGLLLLGSELASNEDETFDEITRNAVDWRLDTLVYMERYLYAAETILKGSKMVETRRRWALRVEPGERRDEAGEEGRDVVTASVTRSASHVSLDTDTAEITRSTSSSSSKRRLEYRVVEGEEEQVAVRLFEQVQEEERQRRLLQESDETQQVPERRRSVDPSGGSGIYSDSSGAGRDTVGSSRLRRRRGGSQGEATDRKQQGERLHAAAEQDADEARASSERPRRREEKSVEQAALQRMKEKGYIEVLQYVKPWRLDPKTVSKEMPDLWAEVMATEVPTWCPASQTVQEYVQKKDYVLACVDRYYDSGKYFYLCVGTQPEGLTEEGIASRADCTERGWDKQQDQIVAMMQEADEEEEKLGQGISLGSVIFFGSLLLRWYTGSG